MGDTGREHLAPNRGKTAIPQPSGAKSGAIGAQMASIDPELLAVVDAWNELPKAVRAGVTALVRAANEGASSQ